MNILNLRGWEVTDSQEDERDYHIHAKYTSEPTGCPHCKSLFDKLYRHGTRPQELADLPAHGKRVTIRLTRTRYRCQSCGKTFLQPLPDVDKARDGRDMRGVVVLDCSDGRTAFRADDVVSITGGEWKDGTVTRIILRNGERFYVTKPFDEIMKTVWGNFTATGVNDAKVT